MSTGDSAPDYVQPARQSRTLNVIAGIVTLVGALIVMGGVLLGLMPTYAFASDAVGCVLGMVPGALISAIAAVVILGIQAKHRGVIAGMGAAALLMSLCSCGLIGLALMGEDSSNDLKYHGSFPFFALCGLSLILLGSIASIAIAIFTKPQPEPQQQAENVGGSAG